MATLKAPKYRRLKGADSDVEVVGNLTVSGTLTTGATVDGTGAVVLADDFSAAGTSKDPLIATDMSADKIGFFGATPVVQRTTYTQTFSTADKTISDPTASALTVVDGVGTNNQSIAAITADASVIAAVQELAAAINALIVDGADTKAAVNALIDDLQALGLVA